MPNPLTEPTPGYTVNPLDPYDRWGVRPLYLGPVGTEHVGGDTSLTMPSPNVSPVVGWYGQKPVTAATRSNALDIANMASQFGPADVAATRVLSSPMANPAFREWFGKSHVVDEAGRPLTVYKGMYPYDEHGAEVGSIDRPDEFPAFNRGEPGVKIAGFFSDNPSVASRFTGDDWGAVYPAHLSFQNPHIIDAAGEHAANIQFGESGKAFRDAIRSGKYDSIIIRNTADEGNVYIALQPTQIKSAVGNRGTYSSTDPRINYGIAGLLGGGAAAGAATGNGQQQ